MVESLQLFSQDPVGRLLVRSRMWSLRGKRSLAGDERIVHMDELVLSAQLSNITMSSVLTAVALQFLRVANCACYCASTLESAHGSRIESIYWL